MWTERKIWNRVKEHFTEGGISLGPYRSDKINKNPDDLLSILMAYKFVSKIACTGRKVIELNCNEGIGAPILGEFSSSYLGIDPHRNYIRTADKLHIAGKSKDKINFRVGSCKEKDPEKYGAIVMIETPDEKYRLGQSSLPLFIRNNLQPDGLFVFGVYKQENSISPRVRKTLKRIMNKIFHNVFIFGSNGYQMNVVHDRRPGYDLFLGCNKK